MSSFQEECNQILDNPNFLEEDKVDQLEELVSKKYTSSTPAQIEKIIMNIMWKHKDPSKGSNRPEVIKVEERVLSVDLPGLERRLELERQFLELEALRDQANNRKSDIVKVEDKTQREYQELLQKTENLRKELYGDKPKSIVSSPIDQIIEWFNGQVSKSRVEQALKSTSYNVIDAAKLILEQLKKTDAAPSLNGGFFKDDNKSKVMCSFFVKNGSCLRSDCKFSHDIDSRTCRYWLKGFCHSGDSCLFKHSIDLQDYDEPLPLSSSPLPSSSSPAPLTASTTISSNISPKIDFSSVPAFVPTSSQPFVSRIKITRPLAKPKLVPWENTSSNKFFREYVQHRDLAIKYENQRKKYAQQSTDAWKTNQGGKSKQLSDKANRFEDQYFEELKLSDELLYDYSLTTDMELWYELHGYEFNDTIDQVTSIINEIIAKENKNSKNVYLVVPSLASWDYKKTTKPLTLWLDHEGYRYQSFSSGSTQYGSVIALDPWSIS